MNGHKYGREPDAKIHGADNTDVLLRSILELLRQSTIAPRVGVDNRAQFWVEYTKEVAEYDTEFLEKYKNSMDIVLIFAGLFSAVATAFIVAVEPSLSPDPTDTTNALLMMLIHAVDNSTFADQSLGLPQWTGPDPTTIWTQALAYASLSTSLLAALGAVLGKQWLNHFSHFGRGTLDDRGRPRQQKVDGLKKWQFETIMEALPALLQSSLFLFAISLSAYVWVQQKIVASVIVGTTAFGSLFYLVITIASFFSPYCPFQTPVSATLRAFTVIPMRSMEQIAEYSNWRFEKRLPRRPKVGLWTKCLVPVIFLALMTMGPFNFAIQVIWWVSGLVTLGLLIVSGPFIAAYVCLWWLIDRTHTHRVLMNTIQGLHRITRRVNRNVNDMPERLGNFARRVLRDLQPVASEVYSVCWILEVSTHPDVITAATRLVPEVQWPADLDLSVPIQHLYRTFMRSFSDSPDKRSRYHSDQLSDARMLVWAKALIVLLCQSPLGGSEEVSPEFWHNSQLKILHIKERQEDPNITFIFCVLAKLFNLRSATQSYGVQSPKDPIVLKLISRSLLIWFLRPLHRLLELNVHRDLSFLPEARSIVHELLASGVTTMPNEGTLQCLQIIDVYLGQVLQDVGISGTIQEGVQSSRLDPSSENLESCFVTAAISSSDTSVEIEKSKDVLDRILHRVVNSDDAVDPTLSEDLALPLKSLSELRSMPDFQATFEKYDLKSWALRLFSKAVHKATQTLNDEDGALIRSLASSALYIDAHGSIDQVFPVDVPYTLQIWNVEAQSIVDHETFLAYMLSTAQPPDDISIAYGLMMTTPSDDVGLSAIAADSGFVGRLLSSMMSDQPILCHAALRVVRIIMERLLHSENTAIRDTLQCHLLPALRTATFGRITDECVYAVKTFTPDQFLYYERDLCYSEIILTLVQDDDWKRQMDSGDQEHSSRCFALAQSLPEYEPSISGEVSLLALYLLAILSCVLEGLEDSDRWIKWEEWTSQYPAHHLYLIQAAWNDTGALMQYPGVIPLLARYTDTWLLRSDLRDSTGDKLLRISALRDAVHAIAMEQVEAQHQDLVKGIADDLDHLGRTLALYPSN